MSTQKKQQSQKQQDQKIFIGKPLIEWNVPEWEDQGRDRRWYAVAIGIGLLFMLYAFLTNNFLFAIIVVITAFVMILHQGENPDNVDLKITTQGIVVGKNLYKYDVIKHFAVIYKPEEDVRRVYFEFKNVLRNRLALPLNDQDPLKIREILLKYLDEDLERVNEPMSESLARFFRL